MAKAPEPAASFVSRLSLTGRTGGRVRTLAGFRKGVHTEPDSVTPATSAFLARLCEAELATEGEALFARARTLLGYKRREIAFELASPNAALTAKDFTLELAYELEAGDPANYAVTRTLHSLRSAERVRSEGFDGLFSGMFSAVVLTLTQGVRVDAVVDVVESLEDAAGLTVDYPSDCQHCILSVEGVAAQVVCDGATLEMRFTRAGAPRELLEAFDAVRHAFVLTKAGVLSGLL